MARQIAFNPIDYGFAWTADNWYVWDSKVGHSLAMKARNKKLKELRKQGRQVFPFTLPGQLVSRGGIGSGRPHIEHFVNVYYIQDNTPE